MYPVQLYYRLHVHRITVLPGTGTTYYFLIYILYYKYCILLSTTISVYIYTNNVPNESLILHVPQRTYIHIYNICVYICT